MAQLNRLTDPEAIRAAMREYRDLGRSEFLSKYDMGPARHYVVVADGRRYDAKALVAAAFGVQYPAEGPLYADEFSGGDSGANPALARLGFAVSDLRSWTASDEALWRRQAWAEIGAQSVNGTVTPDLRRELGVYGGAQGVWVDKQRTSALDSDGVAVGVLHTGRHYADDLDQDALIYHYPTTRRPASRDAGEVGAVKAAQHLGLPIFVISEAPPSGTRRTVQLGWVIDSDDQTRTFLFNLTEIGKEAVQAPASAATETPFVGIGARPRNRSEVERAIRDPRFKFRVAKAHRGQCVISGIAVPEMLEAAHVIPVEVGGTDDARNGLLLTAGLHRAFDAGLWAIDPDTLTIVTRPNGPSLDDMGITKTSLTGYDPLPAREALDWRFRHFQSGLAQ